MDAGLADVEAALVDPDFLARLGELPTLGHPELLEQRVDGDRVFQRVRYAFTGDLPSAAHRFIDPHRLTWVEESTLDRTTHRTAFRIKPDHYASLLKCAGAFSLQPTGDRATLRVMEGELSVHIPLLGRRVERAIASGLEEHAELEAEILAAWLAERSS